MYLTRFAAALCVVLLAACGGGDSGTNSNPGTGGPGPTVPPVEAGDASVAATTNDAFEPNAVSILAGKSVRWTFSKSHNVTFAAGAGAPDNVPTTASGGVLRTFTTPGTYNYRCTLHAGMTGTVVVQAAASAQASGSR